jgi:hypothetical protein
MEHDLDGWAATYSKYLDGGDGGCGGGAGGFSAGQGFADDYDDEDSFAA